VKVFTYVIATDRGSAPNYEAPCTTLAICKPRIRRVAKPGDLVLAFTGRTVGPNPHAVCWAGLVSEKILFADYWTDARFAGKKPARSDTPDNIYQPDGLHFRQVPNSSHTVDGTGTDLSGQFVLTFQDAWHFGATGPTLPADLGLRMIGGRRNHRVHVVTSDWKRLLVWLNAQRQTHAPTRGPKCRPRHRPPVNVNTRPTGKRVC
jgi:hypothetical protein